MYVQAKLAWDPDEDRRRAPGVRTVAARTCSTRSSWPTSSWSSSSRSAATHVRPADVRDSVLVSSDLGQHAAWLDETLELGVDRLYLHHVPKPQAAFIEAFGDKVLPQLTDRPWPNEHADHQRPVVEERRHLLPRRRDVPRLERRRHRRSRRVVRADRLPGRHRRHHHLADALLPDARPRRRLRHHRLLRRRSPAGDAGRVRRGRPDGARSWVAGRHRPRRQPHLRPPSVVPVGPIRPELALPRLVRLGRLAARRPRRSRRPSPASRAACGPTTARPSSTTSIASTPTSRI